jgi:hypothetical protein
VCSSDLWLHSISLHLIPAEFQARKGEREESRTYDKGNLENVG